MYISQNVELFLWVPQCTSSKFVTCGSKNPQKSLKPWLIQSACVLFTSETHLPWLAGFTVCYLWCLKFGNLTLRAQTTVSCQATFTGQYIPPIMFAETSISSPENLNQIQGRLRNLVEDTSSISSYHMFLTFIYSGESIALFSRTTRSHSHSYTFILGSCPVQQQSGHWAAPLEQSGLRALRCASVMIMSEG